MSDEPKCVRCGVPEQADVHELDYEGEPVYTPGHKFVPPSENKP